MRGEDRVSAPDPRHEQKAAEWFQSITGHATLILDDGARSGLADLLVLDADGSHLGAVEVTRYANEEFRQLIAVMNKRLGDGWQMDLDGLDWEWMVFLERPDARIAGLEAPVHQLLQLLERQEQREARFEPWQVGGWTRRFGSPLPDEYRVAVDAIQAGVSYARAFRRDQPGRVWVSPPGSTGNRDGTHVEDAVASEAHKADNIQKLAGAVGERHLWIWVEQWHPAWSMEEGHPPARPAVLPDGIDRVWAATHSGIVWSATSDESWRVDRRIDTSRGVRG